MKRFNSRYTPIRRSPRVLIDEDSPYFQMRRDSITDYQARRYRAKIRKLQRENTCLKHALKGALIGPDLCKIHMDMWLDETEVETPNTLEKWQAEKLIYLEQRGKNEYPRFCDVCEGPVNEVAGLNWKPPSERGSSHE